MKSISAKKHSSGFTLIEMLFVVGIVSTMCAILCPVALKAKSAANQALCINNLKQMGAATQLYTLDFNGYIPHEDAGSGNEPPIGCDWFSTLDRYLAKGNDDVKKCPGITDAPEDYHTIKMNSNIENGSCNFYKMGTVTNESKTVYLYDGRINNPSIARQIKGTSYSADARRHPGGTNLLFLDFHVASYCPEEEFNGGWPDDGPFVWSCR